MKMRVTGATGAKSLGGEGQPAAVAVLPFDNLTPNTPHAYLADAIPIELQSHFVACARSAGRLAAVRRGSLGHAYRSADDCEKPRGAIRDLGQRRRSR